MAFVNPLARPAAAILPELSPTPVAQGGDKNGPRRSLAARHPQTIGHQVPVRRNGRISLIACRCLAEHPLQSAVEISDEHFATTEAIRKIGKRSKVVGEQQITEGKGTAREAAQQAMREARVPVQRYRPKI